MKSPGTTTVYKARDGYRWRARARGNRIVAESGESYVRRARALAAAKRWGPKGFSVVVKQ